MAEKKWVILCIIGGILMILFGVVGSVGFIGTILEKLMFNDALKAILGPILWFFNLIALGGGISVIIGCFLYNADKEGTGKFIIGIGAGMGLIGLIIAMISSMIGGSVVADMTTFIMSIVNGSYGILGVILTIIARMKL